jgi:diadenosine tetraphosphate (Ap4A) HIT family hydrolase
MEDRECPFCAIASGKGEADLIYQNDDVAWPNLAEVAVDREELVRTLKS